MEAFYVDVDSKEQGEFICKVLADYDAFQFENDVKPDYCNAGGVRFNFPPITEEEWWDTPEDDEEWADILQECGGSDVTHG